MASSLSRIVLFLCVTLSLQAAAQPTGQLSGLAVDRSGAVLSSVRVTVTLEADPTVVRTTTTDTQGRFRITGLPLGRYRIESSLEGFVSRTLGDVEVGVAQSSEVRLELQRPTAGPSVAPPDAPVTYSGPSVASADCDRPRSSSHSSDRSGVRRYRPPEDRD